MMNRLSSVRRLLANAIQHWRLEHVLRLCQEGRITKARAAEIAGVSIYEVMDALRQRGLQAQYTLEEAMTDIKDIMARSKPS